MVLIIVVQVYRIEATFPLCERKNTRNLYQDSECKMNKRSEIYREKCVRAEV